MEYDNSIVKGLHEAIMNAAIKYLAEKGVQDIDILELYCDNLGESIKAGHWSPCTDSSCKVLHYDKLIEQSI